MSISVPTSVVVPTETPPDLVGQGKTWEQRCAEAITERDRLRTELAKTKEERDAYLKELYYYIRKEAPIPTITREDVFAALESEQPFDDFVADVKKQYGLEK